MVRIRSRFAIVVTLLGAAVTHGCGDSSGPSQPTLSGRWALVSIDGGALPHAVRQTRVGSVDVVSGALLFHGLVVNDTLRFTAFDGGGTAAADTTVQGESASYLLRGDTLLVTRVRTPVSYVDTGVVAGDTLRLTVQRIEPQNTTPFALRYQKTP